jgi:hypothetical protein
MAKRRQRKSKKSTAGPKPASTVRAGKKRIVAIKDPGAPKQGPRLLVKLPADATAADRLEAEHFLRVLEANEQLSRKPGPLPPGATHQIETGRTGVKRVVRKRFSAL